MVAAYGPQPLVCKLVMFNNGVLLLFDSGFMHLYCLLAFSSDKFNDLGRESLFM